MARSASRSTLSFVRLGFGLPVSGSWATPDVLVDVARLAERLGYSTLWTFQRLLSPPSGAWGEAYRSVHDPVVALAFAAAATTRIRLGVAVLNAPFQAPLVLATQLASLDVLSGGRVDAGLGLGWAREEFAAVGVPFAQRAARLEETVAVLRAAWGADPVSFAGRFTVLETASVQPKPVQRPAIPLLLGGSAEPALRRVGRVADGWVSASRQDLRRLADPVAVVRAAAEDAGRDPASLRVVVRGVPHLGEEVRDRAGARRLLSGSERQVRSDIDLLAQQGATEVFLDLNFDPAVGSPDADPAASLSRAREILNAFAPG